MKKKQHVFLNDAQDNEKQKHNKFVAKVDKNSINDKGDGLVMFGRAGLVITDDTEMWSGYRYDIKTMDISGYGGILTADHSRSIQSIIGRAIGTRKVGGKKVVVDGFQFATEENALALYAYNMLKSGYLTDFSIETVGPWPDESGVFESSSLVGLSAVVVGNNKSAKINEVALNSIEEAKELGLDTSIVEKNFVCYDNAEQKTQTKNSKTNEENMKYKLITNSRGFTVKVAYQDESGKAVEVMIPAGQSIQVLADQASAVETQVSEATEPAKPVGPVVPAVEAKNDNSEVLAAINKISERQDAFEKQLFDNAAEEPTFSKAKGRKSTSSNSYKDIGYMERHAEQIMAFMAMKKGDQSGATVLSNINAFHLEALQKDSIVSNSVTLADFGNFVISPELIAEIQGKRSNFRNLLDKVTFRETLSLQMAYLTRSGEINMQPVEMCDDGADGNLKPISEYTAAITTKDLEELAAVTPVCNAATRFLAADLLGDVAAGYRNDYDRKLSQLVIARLQQAVNGNGNDIVYDRTSATTSLTSWVDVWTGLQEFVENGYFILNYKSRGQLIKDAISAGISGPLAQTLLTGNLSPILGDQYIVVPNSLMPTLNTAETKTFVVDGANVTITEGLFYTDLSEFTGRVSGGLQYDLSTDAAYEDAGTVKSAFQRNEVVLRGSFFRGGAIMDTDQVASLGAAGVS